MLYTGAQTWEELQRRFPRHATEVKLAQFSKLKIKGKQIPMVNSVFNLSDIKNMSGRSV